jgi:hypothetical protein
MITGVIGIVGLILPIMALPKSMSCGFLWYFWSLPCFLPLSQCQFQPQQCKCWHRIQLRAQISAVFLLISNLVAVGIGTTLVALITDKIFENPLMVGMSLSIVGTISCVLAFILLKKGCKAFSASMQKEHAS